MLQRSRFDFLPKQQSVVEVRGAKHIDALFFGLGVPSRSSVETVLSGFRALVTPIAEYAANNTNALTLHKINQCHGDLLEVGGSKESGANWERVFAAQRQFLQFPNRTLTGFFSSSGEQPPAEYALEREAGV